MDQYPGATGLEFGESGDGEFGEFGEAGFGEFGEVGLGEWETGELGEFGAAEFGEVSADHEEILGGILGSPSAGEVGSPLSEDEQVQLASELLEVSSEEELEQFLGNVFKKIARGVGAVIRSPVGRALGGVLKSVAKKALPVVGGALGSMVAPGIGTAIGSKLGSMAGGLFEVQLEGMPQEQAEYEVARRYVNLAASAARHAAIARPRPGLDPRTVARAAVARAARVHAPGVYRSIIPSLRVIGTPYSQRTIRTPGTTPAYRPTLPPVAARTAPAYAAPQYLSPPRFVAPSIPPAVVAAPLAPPPLAAVPLGAPLTGRWVRRGRKILVLGV